MCFSFVSIVRGTDFYGLVTRPSCSRLLKSVCKLVCQQAGSRNGMRSILVVSEHNMTADGIRQRLHCPRGLCCPSIRMNSHLTEVMSESILELIASLLIQRL